MQTGRRAMSEHIDSTPLLTWARKKNVILKPPAETQSSRCCIFGVCANRFFDFLQAALKERGFLVQTGRRAMSEHIDSTPLLTWARKKNVILKPPAETQSSRCCIFDPEGTFNDFRGATVPVGLKAHGAAFLASTPAGFLIFCRRL